MSWVQSGEFGISAREHPWVWSRWPGRRGQHRNSSFLFPAVYAQGRQRLCCPWGWVGQLLTKITGSWVDLRIALDTMLQVYSDTTQPSCWTAKWGPSLPGQFTTLTGLSGHMVQ